MTWRGKPFVRLHLRTLEGLLRRPFSDPTGMVKGLAAIDGSFGRGGPDAHLAQEEVFFVLAQGRLEIPIDKL
mgnify:CR=1 FL=1